MDKQISNKEDIPKLRMYLGWAVAVLVLIASAIVIIGILSRDCSVCDLVDDNCGAVAPVQTEVPADSLVTDITPAAVDEFAGYKAQIDSLQRALDEANTKLEQYKQRVYSLINNR